MNCRWTGWAFAAAGLAASLSYGCAGVTMTAASSINPVMFGSAKTLGIGTATPESSRVPGGTAFHHRESVWGILAFAGYGGADFGESTTDPAGDDEKNHDWAPILAGGLNPARLDWKVFRATGENPARRVELTSIRCGGINSVFLFGIMITNGCELEGVSPAAE